jgi:sodium transport system permease protein
MTADPHGVSGMPPRALSHRAPSVPRILRLCLKELRETLRDRRTIATLFLMPLLVYPLLSVAFQRFLVSNLKPAVGRTEYVLGFLNQADAQELESYLVLGEEIIAQRQNRAGQQGGADSHRGPSAELRPHRKAARSARQQKPTLPPRTVQASYEVVGDLHQSVVDGRVDAAVRIKSVRPLSRNGTGKAIDCEIIYDPQTPASREVFNWIETRLSAVNQRSLEIQLREKGVRSPVIPVIAAQRPLEVSAGGVAAGPSLATLVPLILILMTITGAVYPAIDLTAGERERGTLEMLVAAPVPRMQLLLAKYIAVLTVALLTAVVNLTAMVLTVVCVGLAPFLFGEAGISLNVLCAVAALLLLFAAFFSALLLAVTSFARSFKEAQAYLIPLMLASIAPGMLSMIPDLKLEGPLAVTPLVNIVLLARDLLQHTADPVTALWVVISTAFFAVAAISVAAQIFGTDAILYGGHGTWSDLFRRSSRAAQAPTVTSALLCLALMFPAYFLASSLLAQAATVSLRTRLLMAALVTILVFFQIPLAAALINRVDIGTGFRLRKASPIAFVGALFLGLSLWPFAHEAFVLLARWDIAPVDERTLETARQFAQKIQRLSPVIVIGAIAVVPAVCEEFFFRGFLLSALRKSLSDPRAIVISSLLFGAFHLVAIEQLHFERFVPSTCLGLVLGWLCVRSESVLPGMVLHGVHNGFLLLTGIYQKELAAWGLGLAQTTSLADVNLPASWLLTAAGGAAAGFAFVWLATAGRRSAHLSLRT